MIKLVSIDALRANGKTIPPQIHTVPALRLLDAAKTVIYGKQVFDYLLLPGSGKLLVGVGNSAPSSQPPPPTNPATPSEPIAYSIVTNGLSDQFSMIEDKEHPMLGMTDRAYQWSSVASSDHVSVPASTPFQEETRNRKSLPDLDAFRAQRELDLKQSDINTSALPPPSFTR